MKRWLRVFTVAVGSMLVLVSSGSGAGPHHGHGHHGHDSHHALGGHALSHQGGLHHGGLHQGDLHQGHSLPHAVHHQRHYNYRYSYPSHLRYGSYYSPGHYYPRNYYPPYGYGYYYGTGIYGTYYGTNLYVGPTRQVLPPAGPVNVRRPLVDPNVVGLNRGIEAPPVRAANDVARARALRFIGHGDRQFRDQEYQEAMHRYKTAARAAGDWADVYFRQGFALVALERTDDAVAAFKKGLALDPAWPTSGFHLDQLYAGNLQAKTLHIDRLAAAAFDNPQDSDRLFLVAVYLYFDGERERSVRFFRRAADLAQHNDNHVQGFLRALERVAQKGAGQEI